MQPYPKPSPMGGTLIREVIQFMRLKGMKPPIDSYILIAVSGGSDSVALAHLLTRYGRKICSKEAITLLHMNHGWRGEESDGDADFVRLLSEKWGVPLLSYRLKLNKKPKGESPENVARKARKEIYKKLTQKSPKFILTAHHADDLAETVLWRFFTGKMTTHGGGIRFQEGSELRPLLRVRKRDLQEYLRQEGVPWREDRTNHEGKLLRSQMRKTLLPAIEALFPKAVEHITRHALSLQMSSGLNPNPLISQRKKFTP